MSQKVLVVEDDINIAELLRLYLQKDGFEVSHAADGGKAVEMAKEIQPDLVLLDIMLPGTDGFALCRAAREQGDAPILFVTAREDEQDKQDANGIYGNANQSDANILAVLDLRNKEMTLISVSRDAMCTLDILNSAGEHVGTATAQLALAYAYGDGAERSCELTSAAVSRLFYDLPIPVYGSIYMQGIRQLVDSVGGVTVTPDTSIPGFAAGQPVTLTGKLTENYIRYRADSTEGNNQRMQRQKQVVLALVHKMLAQVKEDPASILALYNNIRRNTTTNINTAMMVYLAQQASGMHFSDDIVNVPGTSVMGEQRHAEYQVDSDALLELILSIFYEPVGG